MLNISPKQYKLLVDVTKEYCQGIYSNMNYSLADAYQGIFLKLNVKQAGNPAIVSDVDAILKAIDLSNISPDGSENLGIYLHIEFDSKQGLIILPPPFKTFTKK